MRKCQKCAQPATIHLTDIIHQQKRETHLCEACARAAHLIPEGPEEIDISALLHFMLSPTGLATTSAEPVEAACEHCGTTWAQFRNSGRLGCAQDYDTFLEKLLPLLEQIHRTTLHQGKQPRRAQRKLRERERAALTIQLQQAIREERYEEAARLRDQLRQADLQ